MTEEAGFECRGQDSDSHLPLSPLPYPCVSLGNQSHNLLQTTSLRGISSAGTTLARWSIPTTTTATTKTIAFLYPSGSPPVDSRRLGLSYYILERFGLVCCGTTLANLPRFSLRFGSFVVGLFMQTQTFPVSPSNLPARLSGKESMLILPS